MKYITLILTLLFTTLLPAQNNIIVKGAVYDNESKKPLSRASVYLLTDCDSLSISNFKLLTDSSGHFTLTCEIGNQIGISHIGYHPVMHKLTDDQDSISFYMIQSDHRLDEASIISDYFYNRQRILHGDGIMVSSGSNTLDYITAYSFQRKDVGESVWLKMKIENKRRDVLSRFLNNLGYEVLYRRYFSSEEDFFSPSINFDKVIKSRQGQYWNLYLKSGYFWNFKDSRIDDKDIFYVGKILYNKDISKRFSLFPIGGFGYNYNTNNDIDFLHKDYSANLQFNSSYYYRMFYIRGGAGYYWDMDNRMGNTENGFTYNIIGRFSKHFLKGGLSGRGSFGVNIYAGYIWQQHQKGYVLLTISLDLLKSKPNPTYYYY